MQNKKLCIATDLDGTFLEGTTAEKEQFYQFLSQEKERIAVIFVTGRTLGLVKNLYQGGLNFIPDYIIADHGSVIVRGENFEYVDEIQSEIMEKWENARHDELRSLLDIQTVQKQPFNPPFCHAYYYQKDTFDMSIVPEIQSLGFECILSHDVYLDILPSNVGKGSTLKKLIRSEGCDEKKVITCGDSLNDLPLFQSGYKSIAVANLEPALLAPIENMDNVYLSQHPGISGIIDGLMHYKIQDLF
ncbi:HAD-IIB family hydrolase [Simkania sp.]|uniref:HAD-IIB family hydrolase n=1 Tax=Simkania sp. TaxID=34094 RepID=UPI003B51F83D